MPLRLTSSGHDFLEALRNEEVWNSLKNPALKMQALEH
ncbi:DUF2513 domain-containing protein [Escherichia coli]